MEVCCWALRVECEKLHKSVKLLIHLKPLNLQNGQNTCLHEFRIILGHLILIDIPRIFITWILSYTTSNNCGHLVTRLEVELLRPNTYLINAWSAIFINKFISGTNTLSPNIGALFIWNIFLLRKFFFYNLLFWTSQVLFNFMFRQIRWKPWKRLFF